MIFRNFFSPKKRTDENLDALKICDKIIRAYNYDELENAGINKRRDYYSLTFTKNGFYFKLFSNVPKHAEILISKDKIMVKSYKFFKEDVPIARKFLERIWDEFGTNIKRNLIEISRRPSRNCEYEFDQIQVKHYIIPFVFSL